MTTGDDALREFIVRVEGDASGTGFLVSADYVVTCAHVVDDWGCGNLEGDEYRYVPGTKEVSIRFADDPEDYTADVVTTWLPDAALLRLRKPAARPPVSLVADIRREHVSAIERSSAFVAGFSEVAPDVLRRSGITRIVRWSSLGTEHLSEIQVEGGQPRGMSGSPMLVPARGGYACLGMLYRGGDETAVSHLILADVLRAKIVIYVPGIPPVLDAHDCLVQTEDPADEALLAIGKDRELKFLRYGDAAGNLRTEGPIPLSRVYVIRVEQENRIHELLQIHRQRNQGTWVSVEGQAGAGKTSLLCQIYHSLGKDETLVLQPFAAQHISEGCAEERALIQFLLKRHPYRTCVVLIDTLDLIVGRGDKSLASFLGWLKTQRVFCLTACRPLEARRLSSLEAPDHFVKIGRYTEREAQAAIGRYVDVAYGSLPESQRADQSRDMWNIVEGRRKMQELNLEPLILRMMFEAYPPDPVPVDINTALLYDAYWDRCVIRDRLKDIDPQRQKLRETVACRLAHAILFRGGVVFDEAILEADFEVCWQSHAISPFPAEVLYDLRSSRAIEDADGIGNIRFFHQSMLEFAAARFILVSPRAVREECLKRIRSDLEQGIFFRSPVLVQMAVQDANTGGHVWKDVLRVLFQIGSETACHLTLEILGKISDQEFSASILRDWQARHAERVAECAVAAVGNYPKLRIPFGLCVLEAAVHTEIDNRVFALCAQRFAPLDPVGVLDFLARILPLVKNRKRVDDEARGQYRNVLIACLDAGGPAALPLLASVFSALNPGHQRGCLESLAGRVNPESVGAIVPFLRALVPLLYSERVVDVLEHFLKLLYRIHEVAPQLGLTLANDILAGGQPPDMVNDARLRGSLEGRIMRNSDTVRDALQGVMATDHLQRLTSAAALAASPAAEHEAIFRAFQSCDLASLTDEVRTSLLEIAGDIGATHPRILLEFVNQCPWPVNGAGNAWRKMAACLAGALRQEFKWWLMARMETEPRMTRMTGVGISLLLQSDPAALMEGEIEDICRRVWTANLDCRRAFAECTGWIARAEPELASRILQEWMKTRNCEVWATVARSLAGCMVANPDWVVQQLPLLIRAAMSRKGHGLVAKLLEALREWPDEQFLVLLEFLEDQLTDRVLAAFPQDICQVAFLMLVQKVARKAPARAFLLLRRASVANRGPAGASMAAAATIAGHVADERILAQLLDHLLDAAPHANPRNARNALRTGLPVIDAKLGSRRVIGQFFAAYSGIEDGDTLKFLIKAVHALPSWNAEDKARLLRDTGHITGEVRSYLMGLS